MSALLLLLACGSVDMEAGPRAAPAVKADPVVAQMRERPLEYTRHGRCRMDCRKIDEGEVAAILHEDGVLKPERTRLDGECPTYALEGPTDDGQKVRIVYAACDRETRVVTAIDLGKEWPCDCF